MAFGSRSDERPLLATASTDQTVRLWDPTAGQPVGEPLTGHTESVEAVGFGAGAGGHPLLGTASDDQTVRLWDAATGSLTSISPLLEPASSLTVDTSEINVACGSSLAKFTIESSQPGARTRQP